MIWTISYGTYDMQKNLPLAAKVKEMPLYNRHIRIFYYCLVLENEFWLCPDFEFQASKNDFIHYLKNSIFVTNYSEDKNQFQVEEKHTNG